MVTPINDLNQKIELKTKIDFLTSEERKQIHKIVDTNIKTMIDVYNDFSEEDKKKEGCRDLKHFIYYEDQVNDIKEIFTNIKQRVTEKEQEDVEVLKENILKIMERMVQGINYWEDAEGLQKEIEFQHLKNYIINDLLKHVELNDRVEKQLEKASIGKSEQEKIEDIYWMKDKPQELLEEIKNGNLSEVAITMLEKGEQDAEIHLKAIGLSEIKNKEIAKDLQEEISDKTQKIEVANDRIDELEALVNELRQQLGEKTEKLDIAEQKVEEYESKINEIDNFIYCSVEKTLSDHLPKKQNKFRQLKTKIKTSYQKLIEKKKEFIAKIEVKNK